VRSDREEGGLPVPWYLLLNGTEPRWRLHDTVDSADLEKSLARVIRNGLIVYTLASRNEGETFQSLTINGKNLVTYVITEQDDPDPAKTRSRYEAAGF
jgi:NADPH:quinone reductase-like Zn-dependent oxidoreductase